MQGSFEDLFPLHETTPLKLDEVTPGHFSLTRFMNDQGSYDYDPETTFEMPADAFNYTQQRTDDGSDSSDDEDSFEDDTGEDKLKNGPYFEFLVQHPAYKWLLATLEREATLMRASPDLFEEIRTSILGALPAFQEKVSRRVAPRGYKATFKVFWDPLGFLHEQQYDESPEDALRTAITLTGAPGNAQAMTALEYLCNVWPTTGSYIMQLLTGAISSTSDHSACGKCPQVIHFSAQTLISWLSPATRWYRARRPHRRRSVHRYYDRYRRLACRSWTAISMAWSRPSLITI